MRLALRLGKTLSQLRAEMSAEELRLWIAFDEMSPIGDERSDIQTAIIASAPLMAQGIKVNVWDMLPPWSRPPLDDEEVIVAETDEDGEQALKAIFKTHFVKIKPS